MCICALDSRPEKIEKKDNKSSEVSSTGDRKGSNSNKPTSDGAKQSSNENGDVKSTAAAEKKDDPKKSGNDKDDRLVFLQKKKKKTFLLNTVLVHKHIIYALRVLTSLRNRLRNIFKINSSSDWSHLKCVFEGAIIQFQFYQSRKCEVELCAEILTDFFSHSQRSEDIVIEIIF